MNFTATEKIYADKARKEIVTIEMDADTWSKLEQSFIWKSFMDYVDRLPQMSNEQIKRAKPLSNNVLFGTGDRLIIHRSGRVDGPETLFGTEEINLRIRGGEPLQYTIKGEVVNR